MKVHYKRFVSMVHLFSLMVFPLFGETTKEMAPSPSDQPCCPAKICIPPGQFPSDCGPNVYAYAAYTLWTAREAGLSVAAANYSLTNDTVAQGSIFYPENKLRSGFKVGLGAYIPHDTWDALIEYTWFDNNSNKIRDLGVPVGLAVSTRPVTQLLTVSVLNSAEARWKNFFNRIDAQLGRTFFAGSYLTLRPFMGLVGAWEKERFDINYILTTSAVPCLTRCKQNWWSIGPYGGLDNTFTFYTGCSYQWSLFLDSGVALTWGNFTDKETLTNTYEIMFYNVSNSQSTVSPMVEIDLGLRLETWWADNSWMFLLQAGWELQAWFNHNQFSTIGTNSGLFSLQGFTLKAQIGF